MWWVGWWVGGEIELEKFVVVGMGVEVGHVGVVRHVTVEGHVMAEVLGFERL